MDSIDLSKVEIKKYAFQKKPKRVFKIKKIIYFICLFISFSLGLLIGTQIIKKNPQRKKDKRNSNKKLDFTNFITYAQVLEDFILYCIFYDIDKGFYIDVGANDPNKISVTKAFYLKGWYGINIEPLPKAFSDLLKYRTRDINLNYGVGQKDDILKFYVKGVGSTLNKNFSKNSKVINIKIHPMSKICNLYVPKNKEIEFCKIDVEGYEKNVLLGYDFVNNRPKVFCMESTIPGSFIPNYNEWEYILLENGYKFGFQYKINRYYFDSKIDNINKRFVNLKKYIKQYKKILQINK